MNYKTAAFVAAGAFFISFLSALIGGVSFFDVLLRAFFWALLSGGLTVGGSILLKMVVPELFAPSAPESPESREMPDLQTSSRVDIALDDEVPAQGFVEEMEESDEGEAFSRERERRRQEKTPSVPEAAQSPPPVQHPPQESASTEEALPEIGAFLDSFRSSPEDADQTSSPQAPPAPSAEAYGAVDSELSGYSAPRSGVTPFEDGQEHDPAVLAKAVQTVLKKDQ